MKDSVTRLEILTKEEFYKNPDFYRKRFREIELSINPHLVECQLEDWDSFFERHPVNSFVFLVEGSTIVSFMYATPHRDYECYEDTDLTHWGINYIKTHIDFQRKGYGKMVALFGLKDMLLKGALKVDAMPNNMSMPILKQIANEYGLPSLERNYMGVVTLLDIEKIKNSNDKPLVHLDSQK